MRNRTAHIIVSLIYKDACLIHNSTFKNFMRISEMGVPGLYIYLLVAKLLALENLSLWQILN